MSTGISDSTEQRAWLTLLRTPSIGAVGAAALLQRFESPQVLLSAGTPAWHEAGLSADACAWLGAPDSRALDSDQSWLEAPNHHLVTCRDAAYPRRLHETARAPIALFVVGDPQVLTMPQLAIVGSRNPTRDGTQQSHDFAQCLARSGLIIASGLALGIDAAAHRGALEAQGVTVAVCGTGLDRVYPARHLKLAHTIAEQGALVSEFPPGTPARPHHFPQRNRILSGLSLGVLVVEAARRSGSLITARMAMEQGREVFAMPGSIHNPLARGCHRLLRDGAKLVECADDVLEELAPLIGSEPPAQSPAPEMPPAEDHFSHDPDYRRLMTALTPGPKGVDELVEVTELTPEAVSSMLLTLELQGRVAPVPGGAYTRLK